MVVCKTALCVHTSVQKTSLFKPICIVMVMIVIRMVIMADNCIYPCIRTHIWIIHRSCTIVWVIHSFGSELVDIVLAFVGAVAELDSYSQPMLV